MDDYETRQFHNVTHFHDFVYGDDRKPKEIVLIEPDYKELLFFKKTNEPKKTYILL